MLMPLLVRPATGTGLQNTLCRTLTHRRLDLESHRGGPEHTFLPNRLGKQLSLQGDFNVPAASNLVIP